MSLCFDGSSKLKNEKYFKTDKYNNFTKNLKATLMGQVSVSSLVKSLSMGESIKKEHMCLPEKS